MLPAAHRLRSAAEFTHTTRRGAKASRGRVVVYVADGGEGPPRAGVVTSRAVGGSVVRHRAARRIRGALQPLVPTLPDGTWVVVRALPGADVAPGLARDVAAGLAAGLSAGLERRR